MAKRNAERRRYLRVEVPVELRVIAKNIIIDKVKAKNISPLGIRFETKEPLKEGDVVDLTLTLPDTNNPVHIQGKVIWQKKISLEDNAPLDIGCEFTKIEEDNKNTFLKYFCDIIYNKPKP